MSDLKNIRDQFISKLENELNVDEINNIKIKLFNIFIKIKKHLIP